MRPGLNSSAAIAALMFVVAVPAVSASPLRVSFDFSRTAIGLDVAVKGTPLYMLLDTGVDPSAIDLDRAGALGLKVDRGAGGEASGEGNAKQALAYPASIDGLSIGGRAIPPIDALALDMSTLSKRYGRKLDGVLGYSFLNGRIVLIDYPRARLGILERPADAAADVQACRVHWSTPLKSFADDTIPVIPDFHFGQASAPVSLDTGSNGGIELYQAALGLPGLPAGLIETGETESTGARGDAVTKKYMLRERVGFGFVSLPENQIVTVGSVKGSADTRVANVGNRIFAAMKLKMLLNYRDRFMTFYGGCGAAPGPPH